MCGYQQNLTLVTKSLESCEMGLDSILESFSKSLSGHLALDYKNKLTDKIFQNWTPQLHLISWENAAQTGLFNQVDFMLCSIPGADTYIISMSSFSGVW